MDEENDQTLGEELNAAEEQIIEAAESDLDSLIRFGFDFLQPYPYLQALLLIVAFVILAKLVDRACSGIIRRVTARTDTVLDDRFIDILHRPVIVSISMMGLILATYRVDMDQWIQNTTLNIIDTILIFVWVIFGVRLSKLLLDAMVKSEKRFGFAQPATKPLLSNAFAVILFLTAVYAILVAWEINVTETPASLSERNIRSAVPGTPIIPAPSKLTNAIPVIAVMPLTPATPVSRPPIRVPGCSALKVFRIFSGIRLLMTGPRV